MIEHRQASDATWAPLPVPMAGFGNHFCSEAVAGAVPLGRNSPQHVTYGLYAEQLSGTAFTAPRADNRRSWLYRLRPSAGHAAFQAYPQGLLRSGPFDELPPTPNRLRWNPPAMPDAPTDFIDGLLSYGGNGDPATCCGMAVHLYAINRCMLQRVLSNADGELLLLPQAGALRVDTELGSMDVAPGELAVIPRGLRFRVRLHAGTAVGYVCENYGIPFRLPELGPIGSNGLANARDFLIPHAGFEDVDTPTDWVHKFAGRLWHTVLPHSPLDVVAWHGNLAPYTYPLARFNTMGTVSHDHPDPSIFTVLTSPSDVPGTANVDFVVFPPRWMVAEDTFRPPWFHRNVMSEFMGLIQGRYDAKAQGFVPGGASLHNAMSAHGPDQASYQQAVNARLGPEKIEDTLAFMFESRCIIRPTRYALECPQLQRDYDACWSGFAKARLPACGPATAPSPEQQ